MKEPKVIEIFADNGEHSHWQLIDDNGEILWSEEPNEVKNNAVLPFDSVTKGTVCPKCKSKYVYYWLNDQTFECDDCNEQWKTVC